MRGYELNVRGHARPEAARTGQKDLDEGIWENKERRVQACA